jgi:hypothetical protein
VSSMILRTNIMRLFLSLGRLSQLSYVTFLTHSRFSADWQVISVSKYVNTRGTTRESLNEFLQGVPN